MRRQALPDAPREIWRTGGAAILLTNGDLTAGRSAGGWGASVRATRAVSSGKHYFEVVVHTPGTDIGVATPAASMDTIAGYTFPTPAGFYTQNINGWRISGASSLQGVGIGGGTSIVGVALDMDAKTITVHRHGTGASGYGGGATASLAGVSEAYPVVSAGTSAAVSLATANFGQSDFYCPPPAGFNAGLWVLGSTCPLTEFPPRGSLEGASPYRPRTSTQVVAQTLDCAQVLRSHNKKI